MKKQVSILILVFSGFALNAQIFLAEAPLPYAVNHNQRLITRDSVGGIYVAFPGFGGNIEGVFYNDSIGDWCEQYTITEGQGLTLAISDNNQIHLIYESLNERVQIKYKTSWDFVNWSEEIILSDTNYNCSTPIADVDSSNTLNVFWTMDNADSTQSLVYVRCNDGSLMERKTVFTKNEINDLAMANHLQYYNDRMHFAIQYNQDSIRFYQSLDHLETYELLHAVIGSAPAITYNSEYDIYDELGLVRMLYINNENQVIETETFDLFPNLYENVMYEVDNAQMIWVNNIAPPIGYSFLYTDGYELVHEFSYGPHWNFNTELETVDFIYEPGYTYASIAYKHFNFDFVDFVWNDTDAIVYMRDDKYDYPWGVDDIEDGKGFSITGSPNPFTESITFEINVKDIELIPEIQIYDTKMNLVKVVNFTKRRKGEYSFTWNGSNVEGIKLKPGAYIILCTVGDKRVAKKVIYKP